MPSAARMVTNSRGIAGSIAPVASTRCMVCCTGLPPSGDLESMGSALIRAAAEALTLTRRGGRLDRVQHAMARHRVFKGGAEVRSLAIISGETRVRLRNVGGRARRLRRRPPVLLWHRQHLQRGLRAFSAVYLHLEDLRLPAGRGELQLALRAVDLPHEIRTPRPPAAVVDRDCRPALQQAIDDDLILRVHE